MDRTVKRDIKKRYGKLLERYKGNGGEVHCYICEQCGQLTKTKDVAEGLVPMGIECPHCNANAMCIADGDTAPNKAVTYEWYRPSLDEAYKLAEENKFFQLNFVLNGGLMRRKCSTT